MVSVQVPPQGREAGSNSHPRFNDDVVNSSHVVLERDKVGSIVLVAGATDLDGDVLWYFIAGERVVDFLVLMVVVAVVVAVVVVVVVMVVVVVAVLLKDVSRFDEADCLEVWMDGWWMNRLIVGWMMEYLG